MVRVSQVPNKYLFSVPKVTLVDTNLYKNHKSSVFSFVTFKHETIVFLKKNLQRLI